MRERLYSTPALIIRRSEVGEADRLLTVYTPAYGKLTIAARGVRKMSSKLAGHLELFVHTRLQLARGRTFDVVTDSRVIEHMIQLRSDLDRISQGYYVAELLDQMTPPDNENRALFELTRATLAALDAEDAPGQREMVLRFFEIHLLSLSGYRPHLFHCAQCETALDQAADRFSAAIGGVLCPACASQTALTVPLPLNVFKLLRFLLRADQPEALALQASPGLLSQAGEILRAAYGQVLERDLKSLSFLKMLRS